MAKNDAPEAPATLKIEILHPISHDGVVFSRGVHTLARETARAFLKLRDETRKHCIAREFVSPQAPEGKKTLAPDNAELNKSKTQ